jgi:hypothetical protein
LHFSIINLSLASTQAGARAERCEQCIQFDLIESEIEKRYRAGGGGGMLDGHKLSINTLNCRLRFGSPSALGDSIHFNETFAVIARSAIAIIASYANKLIGIN